MQPFNQGKSGFKSKEAGAVEAPFLSHLNIVSILAFFINIVGSSDRLAGRRTAEKMSALVGVTSWTGSSRISSTIDGAEDGTETGVWFAWLQASHWRVS